MGRKNKNIIGGAASGAAAGSSAGPWGSLIGGAVGGLAGSMNDTDPAKMNAAVPRDVVNRLYAQSVGAQPTIGELRNSAMFDKSLAQQIAAAAAARGTNPAIAQRNIARMAAEQGQAAAQANAQLSAEERNQALGRYLQAQQMNSQVDQINLNQENAANKQADAMLGAGLQAGAASLATNALRGDAKKQMQQQDLQKASSMEIPKAEQALSNEFDDLASSVQKASVQNDAYSLGAKTLNPNAYNRMGLSADMGGYSDKRMKTKVKPESLKVVSDVRQKDLIKTEDLPSNNNLQNQNMQAVQPSQTPVQKNPGAQVPQPQQATPAASAAPVAVSAPAPAFRITGEMLQRAQQSAKSGGNVADISNISGNLSRASGGISQDQLDFYSKEAARQETRGGPSYRDLYQQFINEDLGLQQKQNEAYDAEQANVAQVNAIKDAERMARLNKFYTGMSTPTQGLVASQYVAPIISGNQDVADVKRNPFLQEAPPVASAPTGYSPPNQLGSNPNNGPANFSDERVKSDTKSESTNSKGDFNPKSFLDKLQAYSYEYKDSVKKSPMAGEGRHLSVMAQDLEKAGPVGKSMVKEDPSGNKVVDYGKGFGAILASQAQLNERLSQIEKMYSKKKS